MNDNNEWTTTYAGELFSEHECGSGDYSIIEWHDASGVFAYHRGDIFARQDTLADAQQACADHVPEQES